MGYNKAPGRLSQVRVWASFLVQWVFLGGGPILRKIFHKYFQVLARPISVFFLSSAAQFLRGSGGYRICFRDIDSFVPWRRPRYFETFISYSRDTGVQARCKQRVVHCLERDPASYRSCWTLRYRSTETDVFNTMFPAN